MGTFHLFNKDKLKSEIDFEINTDCVYMHSQNLKKLGFNKFSEESSRPILKIRFNNKEIYRKFYQGSTFGITLGHLCLSRSDERILELDKLKEEKYEVEIEIHKSNLIGKFKYYYDNPKNDIRLTTRLAIWGSLIGIISSILGSFIYDLLKLLYYKY